MPSAIFLSVVLVPLEPLPTLLLLPPLLFPVPQLLTQSLLFCLAAISGVIVVHHEVSDHLAFEAVLLVNLMQNSKVSQREFKAAQKFCSTYYESVTYQ